MNEETVNAYNSFYELLSRDGSDLDKFVAICQRVCANTKLKPQDVANNINRGRADMHRAQHESWLIVASANEIADAMIAGKY